MTEDVTIATIEDKDWIKRIYAEAKEELGSFNLFYAWDDFVSGKKGKFIIVRPKAFIRYDYSNKYHSWVIHDIGVAKDYRGTGLAGYIIKFVPTPMLLKCNQSNTNGNLFYQRIGMKLSGTTFTRKGNPQNIWKCAAW